MLLIFFKFLILVVCFPQSMLLSVKSEHFHTHILNTVNIESHNLSLPLCDNFSYIQRTHVNRIQIHQHLSIFGSSLLLFLHIAYWAFLLVFVLLRVPWVFVFNKLYVQKIACCVTFLYRKPKETHWRSYKIVLHSPWEITSFMAVRDSRLFASKFDLFLSTVKLMQSKMQ